MLSDLLFDLEGPKLTVFKLWSAEVPWRYLRGCASIYFICILFLIYLSIFYNLNLKTCTLKCVTYMSNFNTLRPLTH